MKLSICTDVMGDLAFTDMLDKCVKLGVEGIEMTGGGRQSRHGHDRLDADLAGEADGLLHLLAMALAHRAGVERVGRAVERGDLEAARLDLLQRGLERGLVLQQAVGAEVRTLRPAAAGHLDAFDPELHALVEHVGEGEIAHHVGADGKLHGACSSWRAVYLRSTQAAPASAERTQFSSQRTPSVPASIPG